ncbi:hypothetical protein KCU81_g360, partial [Aureobasidium melanogenum]
MQLNTLQPDRSDTPTAGPGSWCSWFAGGIRYPRGGCLQLFSGRGCMSLIAEAMISPTWYMFVFLVMIIVGASQGNGPCIGIDRITLDYWAAVSHLRSDFTGAAKVGDLQMMSAPFCKRLLYNSYLEYWVRRKSVRIRVTKKDYTGQC